MHLRIQSGDFTGRPGITLGERMVGVTPYQRCDWLAQTFFAGIGEAQWPAEFIDRAPLSAHTGSGGTTSDETPGSKVDSLPSSRSQPRSDGFRIKAVELEDARVIEVDQEASHILVLAVGADNQGGLSSGILGHDGIGSGGNRARPQRPAGIGQKRIRSAGDGNVDPVQQRNELLFQGQLLQVAKRGPTSPRAQVPPSRSFPGRRLRQSGDPDERCGNP